MRYVLLTSNDRTARISPEERSRREAAFVRFQDQMRTRGTTMLGEQIDASQPATTVRCWHGGDVIVSAGSSPVPGEQLTGVFVADCANLDQAIELATTIPTAWFGTVTVSPVLATVPRQEHRLAGQDGVTALAAG